MATTYTVSSGDTLSAIARKYNTTVAALLEANPRLTTEAKYKNGSVIFSGTKLRIPGTETTTTSATTTQAPTTTTQQPTFSIADWRRGEEASLADFYARRNASLGITPDTGSTTDTTPSTTSTTTPTPTTTTPTAGGRTLVFTSQNFDGTVTNVYSDGTSEVLGTPRPATIDPAIAALQAQYQALQDQMNAQRQAAEDAAAKAAAEAAKPKPVEYYRNPTTGELILGPDGKPIAIGPGGSANDVLAYFEALRTAGDAKSRAAIANAYARRTAQSQYDTLNRQSGRDLYAAQKKALNELTRRGITSAPGVAIAAKRAAGAVPLNRRLEALQQYNAAISAADITLAEEQAKADEASRKALIDLTTAANIANDLTGGKING